MKNILFNYKKIILSIMNYKMTLKLVRPKFQILFTIRPAVFQRNFCGKTNYVLSRFRQQYIISNMCLDFADVLL